VKLFAKGFLRKLFISNSVLKVVRMYFEILRCCSATSRRSGRRWDKWEAWDEWGLGVAAAKPDMLAEELFTWTANVQPSRV
jgi:hypothetical protein